MSLTHVTKTATCSSCKEQFPIFLFDGDGDGIMDFMIPEECPNCGHNKFTARFSVDPDSTWIGSMGSNG
jgi:hypothetical protein